jgi:hypothetical protein
MGLPCFFTKQFQEGDAVMVCSHVWEENLVGGFLLPIREGRMERHEPPIEFVYDDKRTAAGNVTVTCLTCAALPPKEVEYAALKWGGGRLELCQTASV